MKCSDKCTSTCEGTIQCTSCSDGYYIANGTCQTCLTTCKTCTDNSTCSTCNVDLFMDSDSICRCTDG